MKLIAIAVLLGVAVSTVFAQAPVHLWGLTSKDYPEVPFVDVNVRAESYAGNSPTVQSYWSGDETQYVIDKDDLVYGRTYYRVHAWLGTWDGQNTDSFTWLNSEVIRRDVTLFNLGK